MNDEKIIRKKFGENMWHLCRKLFPTILSVPGKLSSILLTKFQPSRSLYYDIFNNNLVTNFKNSIYYIYGEESHDYTKTDKTPEELLRSVGYTLYKCDTYEDILKFIKYYKKDERLCSFKDQDRTKNNYVFFAIRDDADSLARSDFINPLRQDSYGTSVISIQFSRDFYNTLSIKNRYNHSVPNPDSTFNNDLEKIVPGLVDSFAKYYGIKEVYSSDRLMIPGYVNDINGRFYKTSIYDNNYYFCRDNILIKMDDNTLDMRYSDKERYLFMDCYVLDLKEKKIVYYPDKGDNKDEYAFVRILGKITDVKITNEDGYKKVVITNKKNEEIIIKLNEDNNIIGYINNNIRYLPNKFLSRNTKLKELQLDRCICIGNECFECNEDLLELYLPNVTMIGHNFLSCNNLIKKCIIPKCRIIGGDFLGFNNSLTEIDVNNVIMVGYGFLNRNSSLKRLEMRSLLKTGESFLYYQELDELITPRLRMIGVNFLGDDQGFKNEPKVWIRCVEFPKIHYKDDIDYRDPMNMLKR